MDQYQQYIATSRYCRWLPEENRRETWEEAVYRYVRYWHDKGLLDEGTASELADAIESLEVMPSMRTLMTAGPALDRDNVAGYNCSYVAVDTPRVFDEIMYVLMCGTGVGFSVERQYIRALPEVAENFTATDTTIKVRDSKIGWATAFRELISCLYSGTVPSWNTSGVRAAGAPLKTFGGRASGPEPLEELFEFTVSMFKGAAGRRLTSLECHDLVCKVAEIVVVGGVRRSALISLSNLSDDRLRRAKMGQWYDTNPERALANNSVAYTERPDMEAWISEWLALVQSKSGERGTFNRSAAVAGALFSGRRDPDWEFGTNPCSEIVLRSKQFCNLSEVVVRSTDTLEDLLRKVRQAAILGTLQSTLTDFRYLSKRWQRNTEEERLLGVSLTGIMDHPILNGSGTYDDYLKWRNSDVEIITNDYLKDVLTLLKEAAVVTNAEWAAKLGVPASTAVTCVKPSGTVSQLVNSSSGIHPRFSDYYIRTVRGDNKDPVTRMLIDADVPNEPDVSKPDSTTVFSFPIASPEGSTTVDQVSALDQLETWLVYQRHWCEHKPSITVYVKDDEWMEVGAWVYKHFDEISGISFLPHTNHVYKQAPYQPISKDEYIELEKSMPSIDWDQLRVIETEDHTTGTQELACTGGVCELVDITS